MSKRFLAFPVPAQYAILQALRWTVFAEGVFLQVPTTEWLRLLHLVDPLIQVDYNSGETYQVQEGRGLLLQLLNHYLDVR
ncbi:hypothetical protein [Hymenobacter sp. GOD-10R]|uniref:hypothetical protein n=1 Tax=Hymenobacter sp. GOD-10R TaxID=3093922 RepID=UPI002D77E74E|nr:hypothetical protein [Hymenobacter sp. GOD-10R]WRQ26609.1 hypothetical protein SD425_16170 [Hymenobacter sp. GOD-10R]